MNEKEKQKVIIEIVKARLASLPSDAVLSIGSYGELKRDEVIKEVDGNTEIGKKIIKVQLEYLRLLKEGIFYGDSPDY